MREDQGFPCVIRGFHADNGSEYINDHVATLLETLRIEFTKSRPRQSNDNALAESKNGAVVRKHLGYAHIPQQCAEQVNAFCMHHLNPYVNFHRPCFFPETITDAKGKERKRYHYRDMKTPYEKLKSLPDVRQYLKLGITVEQLDAQAREDERHGGRLGAEPRTQQAVPSHRGGKQETGMNATGTAARAWMNPTESEQRAETQIRRPSFRLISGLENTGEINPHYSQSDTW